jgi:hypothetical protein
MTEPTPWIAPVSRLEGWLSNAEPGDSCIYAIAPFLGKSAIGSFMRAAADRGEVLLVQRRRGECFEYEARRRAGAGPSPRARALELRDPVTAEHCELLAALTAAVRLGRACPSNKELARLAGLRDRHEAAYEIKKLTAAGAIRIEPGCIAARVIEIVGVGRTADQVDAPLKIGRPLPIAPSGQASLFG